MAPLAIPIALGVATAAAAGGSIYGGVRESQASEYNAKMMDRSAKLANRQADWERLRAKAEADRLANRDKSLLSAQRARFAASGRDPTEESPLMTLIESAATANVDYRSVLQGGEMDAARLNSQADNFRSQAGMYRSQGRDAMIAGGVGATSALASGGLNYAELYTGGRGRQPPSGGYESSFSQRFSGGDNMGWYGGSDWDSGWSSG